MREVKWTAGRWVAWLLVLVIICPVDARTRKGDKFFRLGNDAEDKKLYDKALEYYEQAVAEDPSETAYLLRTRRIRFEAGEMHIDQGRKLRQQGKLEAAAEEFQRAYATDPASMIAQQDLRQTLEMIERNKAAEARPGAKPLTPQERGLTPAQEAKKEAQKRISEMLPAPQLRPISRQISTLRMSNQPPKVLFETVGKLAGINVVLDPEYQQQPGKNFSVDLTNITLEDALDYLAVLTKSFWKALSSNTIFVANDQATKRRDYDDFVVKTFYLNNVTSNQELNEIATALRQVTDIRRMFTFTGQNAIVMRGTSDQVALAEKVIQDLDKPKPEVLVDVLILEVDRSLTQTLGGTFVSGSNNGLSLGISPTIGTTTPSSTNSSGTTTPTTTAGSVAISNFAQMNARDFAVTLPSATLNAILSNSTTKILQSPQVRAIDNMKASLRIGDRVPTATGSYQSGIGAVGVSPLVNTQFQYIDVGTNVDMTPKINSAEEVSLHVEIEISQVKDYVSIGGINEPEIGQRKVTHDIRVREGEVSLIGGLMQDQDSNTVSGIPGLDKIPLLGRLFSTEAITRSHGELLIALIPHIVRAPEITALNLKGVAAGTDQNVKLSWGPSPDRNPPALAGPGPAAEIVEPERTPAPVHMMPPMGPGVPSIFGPTPRAPVTTPAPPPPAPPAPLSMRFSSPALSLAPGQTASVTLEVQNASDLFSAPIQLKYDPKVIEIEEIQRGDLLGSESENVIFARNIQNSAGAASVNLYRTPGSGGMSGSGALVTIVVKGVGPGTVKLAPEVPLRNSRMQPIHVPVTPQLTVTVK